MEISATEEASPSQLAW